MQMIPFVIMGSTKPKTSQKNSNATLFQAWVSPKTRIISWSHDLKQNSGICANSNFSTIVGEGVEGFNLVFAF